MLLCRFQAIVQRGAANIEKLGDRRRIFALGDQGTGMFPLIVRERPLAPQFLAAFNPACVRSTIKVSLRTFFDGLSGLFDQID